MQDALGIVVFAVVAVGIVAAIVSTMTNGSAYDQIGRGGLSVDRDPGGGTGAPAKVSAGTGAEREQEIRQMLVARSERRVRQGKAPLDVDAEIARLLIPDTHVDPALADEVRQLVLARNARRARQGKPALDVAAQVARQLGDLQGPPAEHGERPRRSSPGSRASDPPAAGGV